MIWQNFALCIPGIQNTLWQSWAENTIYVCIVKLTHLDIYLSFRGYIIVWYYRVV